MSRVQTAFQNVLLEEGQKGQEDEEEDLDSHVMTLWKHKNTAT
jgi:hypothetical protein